MIQFKLKKLGLSLSAGVMWSPCQAHLLRFPFHEGAGMRELMVAHCHAVGWELPPSRQPHVFGGGSSWPSSHPGSTTTPSLAASLGVCAKRRRCLHTSLSVAVSPVRRVRDMTVPAFHWWALPCLDRRGIIIALPSPSSCRTSTVVLFH